MFFVQPTQRLMGFAVFPGQPSPLFEEEEAVTLTGKAQEALDLINQKEIRWGVSNLVFSVTW